MGALNFGTGESRRSPEAVRGGEEGRVEVEEGGRREGGEGGKGKSEACSGRSWSGSTSQEEVQMGYWCAINIQ